MFPYLTVHHLNRDKSDHVPLKVGVAPRSHSTRKKKKKKMFCFEVVWLTSSECANLVRDAWVDGSSTGSTGGVLDKIKNVVWPLENGTGRSLAILTSKLKKRVVD